MTSIKLDHQLKDIWLDLASLVLLDELTLLIAYACSIVRTIVLGVDEAA